MANHRGGSGNFAEDRERASEAGRKGGQHSGNFKNDPQRASEAGKRGKNSHGSRKLTRDSHCSLDAVLISPTQPHRPRRRHLPAVFICRWLRSRRADCTLVAR